jgi:MFS family permease
VTSQSTVARALARAEQPPAQVARFRSALASGTLRGLLTSHALATCAQLVLTLAVAVEVLVRTSSGIWVSVAVSLGFAPYALFSGLAGALADRWPARRVMGWSAAVRCAASVVLVVAVLAGWPVPVLVIVSGLAAVCATPSYPALAAATPQCVPGAQLSAANALVTAVENLAWMAGPGLLGLLLVVGCPTSGVIAAGALVFGLAGLAAFRVPPASPVRLADSEVAQDVYDGYRVVFARPAVRWPMAVAVVDNFLYGYLLVAMLLIGSASPGWMNAALTAGALLALGAVTRVAGRARPELSLVVVMAWFCVAVAGFVLVRTAVPAVLLLAVAGAASMVAEVVAVTALQRRAPQRSLAGVFGVYDQLNVGAIAWGSFLAGQVERWWALGPASVAVAAACLLLVSAAASRMRRTAAAATG